MEFTVPLDSPFNLEYTLESGQVFRWEKQGNWWQGVVGETLLKVMQQGDMLRCVSGSDAVDSVFVSNYFRLDDDIERILGELARDGKLARAIERFYGLHLVRQDKWECLASFVLSTNANIPRIRKMIGAISEKYGREFEVEDETCHAFPTPESLAAARAVDLAYCGLGYRASFLRKVSGSVADGKVDLESFVGMGYEDARKALLSELFGEKVLLGVGPKVADCFLLYSCDMDESFPIDVWIARALAANYPRILGPRLRKRFARERKLKLAPAEYSTISKAARSHFGKHAGYAQQYLYVSARE